MRTERFFVVSPDGATVYGFTLLAGAETAALSFGEGAHVVDTMAGSYTPALYRVVDGALVVEGQGLYDRALGPEVNLAEAANRRSRPIVLALLAKGADPDGRDERGRSALNFAVARGDLVMVKALLARGADPDRPDGRGVAPRALAEEKGRDEISRLFSTGKP